MGKKGKKKQFPGGAANKPRPSAPKSPTPSPSAPDTPVARQPAALAQSQRRSPSRGSIPASPLLDSLLVAGSSEQHPLVEGQRVPMEYRAQVEFRCQRQRINKPTPPPLGWRSHAQQWTDEWVDRVDASVPYRGTGLHLFDAQIDWRLISNSGVDEGFIRPVIGAGGWPIIPGSGIKGIFRRACPADKVQRWCGSPCAGADLSPGVLRFHGAWPSDPSWTQGLLDLAHPQQEWQVGMKGPKQGGAFAVASLFRPKLRIGISSTDSSLSETEWQEIETTLRRALENGIGGRTCVGYGSSGKLSGDLFFECSIEGQGPSAKLLDNSPEFRPTMFRASIRGMALRLFGGLCDEASAKQVVNRIFGSVEGKGDVSLLATAYTDSTVDLGTYGRGGWEQPIYATSGQLHWRLTKGCHSEEEERLLSDLVAALHGLTMSLGGFGRGWRRPDHRIFFPDYGKTPIGCHWQWRNAKSLPAEIRVQSAADLSRLLTHSRKLAERWLQANSRQVGGPASWREVIHPEKMRIWSRRASGPDDAEAIHWFHRPRDGEPASDPRDLRKSDLAGRVNQVGRIWNRLLPLDGDAPPKSASQPAANPMARAGAAMARPSAGRQAAAAPRGEVSIPHWKGAFLESVVLFPEHRLSPAFIKEMNRGAGADFTRVDF